MATTAPVPTAAAVVALLTEESSVFSLRAAVTVIVAAAIAAVLTAEAATAVAVPVAVAVVAVAAAAINRRHRSKKPFFNSSLGSIKNS